MNVLKELRIGADRRVRCDRVEHIPDALPRRVGDLRGELPPSCLADRAGDRIIERRLLPGDVSGRARERKAIEGGGSKPDRRAGRHLPRIHRNPISGAREISERRRLGIETAERRVRERIPGVPDESARKRPRKGVRHQGGVLACLRASRGLCDRVLNELMHNSSEGRGNRPGEARCGFEQSSGLPCLRIGGRE